MQWLNIEIFFKQISTTINDIHLNNGILLIKDNEIQIQFDTIYENISFESITQIYYFQQYQNTMKTTFSIVTKTNNYIFTTVESFDNFINKLQSIQSNYPFNNNIKLLNQEGTYPFEVSIYGKHQYLFLNENSISIPFHNKPFEKEQSECFIVIEDLGTKSIYKRLIICNQNQRLFPHICFETSSSLYDQLIEFNWKIYHIEYYYEIDLLFEHCRKENKDFETILKTKNKYSQKQSEDNDCNSLKFIDLK